MTDDKDSDEVLNSEQYYAVDTETVLPESNFADTLVKTVKEDELVKQLTDRMSQVKKLMDKKKKSAYFGDDFGEVLAGNEPVDMTKEYNILSVGGSYSTKNKMTGVYAFVSSALEADQVDLLDLNTIQTSVNDHFKFLFLRKRFNTIRASSPVSIDYDHDGFHVKDSTFETLDEVEKAISNKAFL